MTNPTDASILAFAKNTDHWVKTVLIPYATAFVGRSGDTLTVVSIVENQRFVDSHWSVSCEGDEIPDDELAPTAHDTLKMNRLGDTLVDGLDRLNDTMTTLCFPDVKPPFVSSPACELALDVEVEEGQAILTLFFANKSHIDGILSSETEILNLLNRIRTHIGS